MMERWTAFSVAVFDSLLGWTLAWPLDVALLLIAILTTVFLLIFRQFATNQEHLRQVHADLSRLRSLRREAAANSDAAELARVGRMRRAVLRAKLRAELPAVLLSLAPFAALLTWGDQRLEFLPPTGNVTVRVLLPRSAAGQIMHLVPEVGVECPDGWIRRLELTDETGSTQSDSGEPMATASWNLAAGGSVTECSLTFRHGDHEVLHPMRFHSSRYAPPRLEHRQWGSTEVLLTPYRPLGRLSSWLGLPAWLVAFLPITLAMYFIVRRVSGIQ